MQYVTGYLAFGIPCELPTPGKWNITKSEYLDDKLFKLVNSEDSPFGDYGIEKNKLVPHREFCLFNVANHVRAYVDMIYAGEFDKLKDLFFECINNAKAREDIFMLVYGKLRKLACYREVNEFMCEEFGNSWHAYVDAIHSMSNHIANRQEEIESILKKQGRYIKNNPYSVSATLDIPKEVYDKDNLSIATIK